MHKKFYHAVQVLAQPPNVQEALFPDFVEVPDELALNWEEALRDKSFGAFFDKLTDTQKTTINKLDSYISSVSGTEVENIWTMQSLHNGEEWKTIRALAADVILEMGWAIDITITPRKDVVYIKDED